MDQSFEKLPPEGYYTDTLDWVEEFVSDKTKINDYYRVIYPEHKLDLKLPKGITNIPHQSFNTEYYGQFSKAFVALIPEGRIWGNNGSVISTNNKLLWDVSMEWNGEIPSKHSIFMEKKLPGIDYLDETVAVVSFIGCPGFYHWMLDLLPRIHLLNQSGYKIDKYVVNRMTSPVHVESLLALGIPKEKIIETHENLHLKAKNVIVTSIPHRNGYPKWAADFLHKELFPSNKSGNAPNKSYERVYISREDAQFRNVINETEVLELLSKYKFKKITLSNKTLENQADIFREAKIIVAPHGAGLSNLVFSDNCKVIELYSEQYVAPVFWLLSNHRNLDYYSLICKGGSPPSPIDRDDHIQVNIDELKKILKIASVKK
ncbi:hypothetical protein WQ57_00860 [Mesobacillus campisalis]|uniref:Glycosyltransferase 61 catalytic domain-containing protein n=1 Tax=Mesobacillus campisalis TaxID=1408103 RepID=A0A0M2T4Y0_9BACI|nr:glycosyltransferase family 61 protein [Mesobacillus campisalis]KKK39870.1 hypothetical protein WQ57_00860 [Mesobacillus campisalis]